LLTVFFSIFKSEIHTVEIQKKMDSKRNVHIGQRCSVTISQSSCQFYVCIHVHEYHTGQMHNLGVVGIDWAISVSNFYLLLEQGSGDVGELVHVVCTALHLY
jgi:hypothetical protein